MELLKSIDKVDKILKESLKEEKLKEQKRKVRETKRQQELHANSMMVGITESEISSIPLTDELHGNLRSIIPKGISIQDRTNALLEKGEFSSRSRKSRKVENPHGARRVKWIAKYKYGQHSKE